MLIKTPLIFLLFIILWGCGEDGNEIIKGDGRQMIRLRTPQPETMVKLGTPQSRVIDILGEPDKITYSVELGMQYDYQNCIVWLDEGIVTNIFCNDIGINAGDVNQ